MESLQRLEIFKGYAQLLKEAEELRYDSLGEVNNDEGRALKTTIQQGSSDQYILRSSCRIEAICSTT